MIDCGAFYPEGEGSTDERDASASERNQQLPAGCTSVNGVFVTHAHLDHIGRLLLLVRQGYSGPIYLTYATACIAPVMLRMQARYDSHSIRNWVWSGSAAASGRQVVLHWANCEWAGKIRNVQQRRCRLVDFDAAGKTQFSPCKICAKKEAASVERLFKVQPYERPIAVAPGVRTTLLNAGHIPGSSSILFEVISPDGVRRVLFSGDLGNGLSPLFEGPHGAPPADLVFVETTYGALAREPGLGAEFQSFRKSVGEAVSMTGVAWIPAFALDRTQKILHQLALAKAEGTIPMDVPIFCPSPSAEEISEVYRMAAGQRLGWFRAGIEGTPTALLPPELFIDLPRSRDERPHIPRPAILITTSGMMDAAFSESLLPAVSDPSVTVFLVGWQDPMSPGGFLKSGAPEIVRGDVRIPIRAKVNDFKCFSAHGSATDIDEWLSNVPRGSHIVLVHGEIKQLDSRAAALRGAGWARVTVAEVGERLLVN